MTKLYKVDSTGELRTWEVSVIGSTVVIEHGRHDGVKVYDSYTATPKNIGRTNETSAHEQANMECDARIAKQYDKGYHDTVKLAQDNAKQFKASKIHKALDDVTLEYTRHWEALPDDVLVQRKYDGIWTGVYRDSGGNIVYLSRGNKTHDIMKYSNVQRFLEANLPDDVIWIGELFCDGTNGWPELRETDVGGVLRAKTLTDERMDKLDSLQFAVFDVYDMNHVSYIERLEEVNEVVGCNPWVFTVDSELINKEDTLKYMTAARKLGWEGVVLRSPEFVYEPGKRSKHCLKVVPFDTRDYIIKDIIYNADNDTVLFVFDEFNATYNRSQDEQYKAFLNKEQYIGCWGSIKYRDFTATGLPKFPKVVDIISGDIK